MPNRVKLLNAAAAATTGLGYKTNMMGLPYTLRISANAVGAILMESSEDSLTGAIGDGTWQTEMGVIAGSAAAGGTEQVLSAANLPTAPATPLMVKIDHSSKWLRATSSGAAGAYTVVLTGRR